MLGVDVSRQPPEFLDVADLQLLVPSTFLCCQLSHFKRKLQTHTNVPNAIELSHTPESYFRIHESPSIAFESTSLQVFAQSKACCASRLRQCKQMQALCIQRQCKIKTLLVEEMTCHLPPTCCCRKHFIKNPTSATRLSARQARTNSIDLQLIIPQQKLHFS